MSRKWNQPRELRQLLDYYMWPAQPPAQDDAGWDQNNPPQLPPQPVPEPDRDPDLASDIEETHKQQLPPDQSSTDRGKRSALSPAYSPTKLVKKQHDAVICSPTDNALPTMLSLHNHWKLSQPPTILLQNTL